ncbi:MAG: NUDIX hydrolase [Flavobacteriales bacterium]|nr:NUDIX hydrolase [Flavobacteriales bacterium]|tara:strand:- start:20139 stop:20774 length:636 start_codon:yes stop_codon:yes gene_type:complete
MSQIYKVFFNNIFFEIKPLSKFKSKDDCSRYIDSFNKFIFIINDELYEKNFKEKQIIYRSSDIVNDWLKLLDYFKKKHNIIIASGGIVESDTDKILFIHRHNFWDLPKGKVEKNEKFEITAQREIFEECGVDQLDLKKFFAKTFHIYFEKKKVILKETNWYLFNSSYSKTFKPQFDEGINKVEWVCKSEIKCKLNKTYSSIKELLNIYLRN